MTFTPSTIAALIIAASFAAGLNVYATVLTLGLLTRAHWVVLPSGLEMLGDWWVIGASGALFAAEFIADKVPGVDLVWNALHTFVRIPIAALLAYGAASHLSPQMQLIATVAGGAIAMVAHSSKTAARVIITPSPEPVSNIAASASEDIVAVGITWLSAHHPWLAASIALAFCLTALLAAQTVMRKLREIWQRLWPAPAV